MDVVTTTFLTPLAEQFGSGPPGRIQLFPAGEFTARDGRPGSMRGVRAKAWRLDPPDAERLLALWRQRQTPVVIDYEHQTQLSASNGRPAPAAGWITDLSWEGDGLYATVEWTRRARDFIRASEYRYISPTFAFHEETGVVLELLCAALTNYPALDGMQSVRAKTAPQGEGAPMNEEVLAHLRSVLGLPADADEAACAAALAKAAEGGGFAAQLKARDDVIATLKAASPARVAAPDPAQYAPVALLKAEQERSAALAAELDKLKAEREASGLNADIDAALKDGRLAKSGEAWARALAQSDPAILRDYLKAAPPIAALTGQQTAQTRSGGAPGAAGLSDEDAYVIHQLGLDPAEYAACKARESM